MLDITFLCHTATVKKNKKRCGTERCGTGTPTRTGEEENDDVVNETPTRKEKLRKQLKQRRSPKKGNILNFPVRYASTSTNYVKLMLFVFTVLY